MTFVSNSHPSDRQIATPLDSQPPIFVSHTHTLGFFLVQNTIKVCQAKWVVVFYQKHHKLAPHHFAYIWWPWCVVNLIAVVLRHSPWQQKRNQKVCEKIGVGRFMATTTIHNRQPMSHFITIIFIVHTFSSLLLYYGPCLLLACVIHVLINQHMI